MKLEYYNGMGSPTITIQRPTDLYPALDFIQNVMLDFVNNGHPDTHNFLACANLLNGMMETARANGFGNENDVDNIEY
jgi:hypothetical protein